MEPSLEEDLVSLENRIRELSSRAKQRLEGGKSPPEIKPHTPGPTETPGETPKVSEPE